MLDKIINKDILNYFFSKNYFGALFELMMSVATKNYFLNQPISAMKRINFSFNIIIGLSLLLSALLLLPSCEKKTSVSALVLPFSNIDVADEIYVIDSDKGGIISLPNGTTIEIPANAFVDKQGNEIAGKVQIKYREFHNAAQIIASGIPMNYDSAGVNYHFQTAGMFEIKGYRLPLTQAQIVPISQEPEEIYINIRNEIRVNMASFAEGNDFNFYALDKITGKWSFEGRADAQPNVKKQQYLDSIAPLTTAPIEPVPAKENQPVFELQTDLKAFPEMEYLSSVMWEYAGENPESNPLAKNNEWIFEGKNEAFEVKPAENNTFLLRVRKGKKELISYIRPVLAGKNLKKAQRKFEEKQQKYLSAKEKREQAEQAKKSEANLIRSFALRGFGIYNWDKIYQNPTPQYSFNAKYEVEGSDFEIKNVFLITGDDRTVINHVSGTNFTFVPSVSNKIIAVLPNNEVAVFSSADFAQLVQNNVIFDKSFTFVLQKQQKIGTMAELEQLIAKL